VTTAAANPDAPAAPHLKSDRHSLIWTPQLPFVVLGVVMSFALAGLVHVLWWGAVGLADHGEVNELARSIRDEQHAEIFKMQRWLADWFDSGSGWGMGPGMTW
jgi:Domain of unknown function (DUF305)